MSGSSLWLAVGVVIGSVGHLVSVIISIGVMSTKKGKDKTNRTLQLPSRDGSLVDQLRSDLEVPDHK